MRNFILSRLKKKILWLHSINIIFLPIPHPPTKHPIIPQCSHFITIFIYSTLVPYHNIHIFNTHNISIVSNQVDIFSPSTNSHIRSKLKYIFIWFFLAQRNRIKEINIIRSNTSVNDNVQQLIALCSNSHLSNWLSALLTCEFNWF